MATGPAPLGAVTTWARTSCSKFLQPFDKSEKSGVYCKASLITEELAKAVRGQAGEGAGARAQAKQDKSEKTELF